MRGAHQSGPPAPSPAGMTALRVDRAGRHRRRRSAVSHAVRATFCVCSPTWVHAPADHWPTCSGRCPHARSACAGPRQQHRRVRCPNSTPPRLPIGSSAPPPTTHVRPLRHLLARSLRSPHRHPRLSVASGRLGVSRQRRSGDARTQPRGGSVVGRSNRRLRDPREARASTAAPARRAAAREAVVVVEAALTWWTYAPSTIAASFQNASVMVEVQALRRAPGGRRVALRQLHATARRARAQP